MSKPDFNFEDVKKHLNTLPDNSERISYLIHIKTKYLQSSALIKLANQLKGTPFEQTFDKLCDLEIQKLKEIGSIEKPDENMLPVGTKLIWKGTPGQFAFIVDLFINKGYLEKPTPYAERNAGIFLEVFEFAGHNPTRESLGRLLHKEQDAISNPEHKGKFMKIPHRNDLDK